MKSYTKKAIGCVVGVVGVTALILICRSNGVNASNDWNAIQASSSDRASRLRTFCRNWRETEYAAKARDLLKETVDNDSRARFSSATARGFAIAREGCLGGLQRGS